jgi:hypothetical protein
MSWRGDAVCDVLSVKGGKAGGFDMPRVVVIGAGIGGAPMAFELRERLGRSAQIDVVAESEWFQFVPSNP